MSEPVTPPVESSAEQAPARRPWQPLGFEKISAAEAEAGFTGTGVDNAIYS